MKERAQPDIFTSNCLKACSFKFNSCFKIGKKRERIEANGLEMK